MYKNSLRFIVFVMVLATAVACSKQGKEYVTGELLLQEDFAQSTAWETFVDDGIDLQVSDGVYRVQTGDDGYIWGLNEAIHSDVVIEVSTNQASTFENNAYGVICRADTSNNGDGYYFLISGDGFYAISKGEGDNVNPLIDWTPNSAINEGQASNTIRAVCIGNYLALYVNDKFLAEVEDSSGYTSGYAGLAATAFDGGDVNVAFDNLTISAASLSN